MKTDVQPSAADDDDQETLPRRAEDDTFQKRLAAHPFLAGVEPHHLETLSKSAATARFAAGQIVFRSGDPANGFYLIESGAVAIEVTKGQPAPVVIDTVTAGEPLGWSWLFEPYKWEFGARATKPVTAIFFSREDLARHHREDLTLGHELFKRMSAVMVRRLQAARRKLVPEPKLLES